MNKKTKTTLTIRFVLIATMLPLALAGCNRKNTSTATAETPFTFENGTITAYTGTETVVVIPSQIQGQAVTRIGDSAFSNKQLTGVTIPDSVTMIGWNAFGDNQLTSVVIPNSVTSMEGSAFLDNQLTSVIIPDSVSWIGSGAFHGNKLTGITIGANVELGFAGDEGYTSAFDDTFENVYYINGKPAGTYTLNNGVWSLGGVPLQTDFAFTNGAVNGYNGTAASVVIPSQILGQTITEIGYYAFFRKELTGVIIPDSVTTIGNSAFEENPLTSITIGPNVELGRDVFDNNFNTVYNNNGKQAGTYTLNNGEWNLAGGQAKRWDDVPTVTENNVQIWRFHGTDMTAEWNRGTLTINGTGWIEGEYPWHDEHLEIYEVIINNGVTVIGSYAFSAFDNGTELTSVTIPNSVTLIGDLAFAYNKLTNVTIPDNVTLIGVAAFENNPLTSITIGANVTLMEGQGGATGAFDDNFITVYNSGGKRAGMYVLSNGAWSYAG